MSSDYRGYSKTSRKYYGYTLTTQEVGDGAGPHFVRAQAVRDSNGALIIECNVAVATPDYLEEVINGVNVMMESTIYDAFAEHDEHKERLDTSHTVMMGTHLNITRLIKPPISPDTSNVEQVFGKRAERMASDKDLTSGVGRQEHNCLTTMQEHMKQWEEEFNRDMELARAARAARAAQCGEGDP